MKVASSAIQLQGGSSSVKSSVTKIEQTTSSQTARISLPQLFQPVRLEISQEGRAALNKSDLDNLANQARQMESPSLTGTGGTGSNSGVESPQDYRLSLLERLLECLFGKRFDFRPFEFRPRQSAPIPTLGLQVTRTAQTTTVTHIEMERQAAVFQAKGQVKTEDGKVIDIDLKLNLSSSFLKASQISVTEESIGIQLVQQLPPGVDPLIINFAAASAGLSSMKFEFDIDCDGKADQISQLLSGSGFLALDKNNDGIVNDGSELFGTKSGDGFKDLSVYDEDKNGWIDENDSIFDKLRIWIKNDDGTDSLIALGEVGIGAIFLGSIATGMNIRDGEDVNGILQKTGFFLRENGSAGTIQHVDFIV